MKTVQPAVPRDLRFGKNTFAGNGPVDLFTSELLVLGVYHEVASILIEAGHHVRVVNLDRALVRAVFGCGGNL